MLQLKLGVFDSGLGGLTVAKELRKTFPGVDLVYLGDTARVPYGIRSVETLNRYLREGCQFLKECDVDAIVLACNTLSSLLPLHPTPGDSAGFLGQIPLLGVIDSGADAAYRASQTKKIGLLATDATVHSKAYEIALKKIDPRVEVFAAAAPLLIPLIEEGWLDGDVTEKVIHHYLEPLIEQGIDTLILGCTHFPLLRPLIQDELLSSGINVIDNGTALSRELSQVLPELTQGHKGSLEVCVTDSPRKFDEIACRFLGEKLTHVRKVILPSLI